MRKYINTITVIAEFSLSDQAMQKVAEFSDYISSLDSATIQTEFQSYPAGYRVTYKITFVSNMLTNSMKIQKYTKYLACISDWAYDCNCLSKYHYNVTRKEENNG